MEDTAWHPVMQEEVKDWGESPKGKIFKFFLGTPLKLWASVGHWALWHFDISKFTDKQRKRVSVTPHCIHVPSEERFLMKLSGGKQEAIAAVTSLPPFNEFLGPRCFDGILVGLWGRSLLEVWW